MIKRLRVTVDGNDYDVTVEVPEESTTPTDAPAVPAPAPPAIPVATPSAKTAPASDAPPGLVAPIGAGDVLCPLAGRVTAVIVSPGQKVKEGDHLVTLEAMKMNTFVFAPRSGDVIAVKAVVGDVVEENQVLVTIG